MKNYSEITESLDITTKQYVDSGLTSKADVNDIPTSIDGLGGGTLTSPMTLTGGDGAAASKMILTSNGQITNESTATLFGRSGGVLIVGHQSMPLRLRGSATNPVYSKDNQTFKELAFKSDIPTIPTLAQVATTGDYNDLLNKPDIPDISSFALKSELTAHINTVATQTTLGHIKMYVEGDTLYLNT